jgi:hypothetical protein
MRYKVIIAITSFFILILSAINIRSGIIFKVKDNTERDALKSEYTDIYETRNKVSKAKIKNVNLPKVAYTYAGTKKPTYTAKPSVKVSSKSLPNTIAIAGRTIRLKPTNCNTMPTPDYSSAYFCSFRNSPNLFIYGHNTANIFGTIKNLGVGATFKVTFNNKTTTYLITDKFIFNVNEINKASNSSTRANIFSGYYRGNSNITIQTCHGPNDSQRLYLKAVAI